MPDARKAGLVHHGLRHGALCAGRTSALRAPPEGPALRDRVADRRADGCRWPARTALPAAGRVPPGRTAHRLSARRIKRLRNCEFAAFFLFLCFEHGGYERQKRAHGADGEQPEPAQGFDFAHQEGDARRLLFVGRHGDYLARCAEQHHQRLFGHDRRFRGHHHDAGRGHGVDRHGDLRRAAEHGGLLQSGQRDPHREVVARRHGLLPGFLQVVRERDPDRHLHVASHLHAFRQGPRAEGHRAGRVGDPPAVPPGQDHAPERQGALPPRNHPHALHRRVLHHHRDQPPRAEGRAEAGALRGDLRGVHEPARTVQQTRTQRRILRPAAGHHAQVPVVGGEGGERQDRRAVDRRIGDPRSQDAAQVFGPEHPGDRL